jgi:hypothetical protein
VGTGDSCTIGDGFRVQEKEIIGCGHWRQLRIRLRYRKVHHPKSVFATLAGEEGATVTFDVDYGVFGEKLRSHGRIEDQ